MKNVIFSLLLMGCLVACNNDPKTPETTAEPADTAAATVTDTSATAATDAPTGADPNSATGRMMQTYTYKSCVVYAAATDYVFNDKNGKEIMVRVENMPEERSIKIPDQMTDPNVVEGPPDANPALVGKEFLLLKNEKGEVVEIRQAR